MHPDPFLTVHLERDAAAFCQAVRRVRLRLKAPPLSVEQHLAILARQGLPRTADELRRVAARL